VGLTRTQIDVGWMWECDSVELFESRPITVWGAVQWRYRLQYKRS
jgi:hypothetical protein